MLLEDLDDRAVGASPGQQVRSMREVVGAEHDVDVACPRHDLVTVLLRQTPTDRDLQIGPGLLERLQRPEVAVELLIRVLPDAARVQHDDVGILDARRSLHAVGGEHARDPLGIVLVHLAPVGADEVPARHR